jgi:IS605 OrfB family transposase
VQAKLGVADHVTLSSPLPLGHCPEVTARMAGRLATKVAIELHDKAPIEDKTKARKIILRFSWERASCEALPALSQLREGLVVSVDLNEGHIEVARLDRSGNPVGQPVTVPLELKGLSTKVRDARTREAITEVITIAKDYGAGAIVVEQLGFEQDKTRERFGRRKAFRATISGFPTTAFRDRLVPMAARAGLAVIGVDPRYTSKVGGRDWCWVLLGGPTAKPSQHKGKGPKPCAKAPTRGQSLATVHHGAAVAIGRRAYAYGLGAETPLRGKARERQAQSASKPRSAPHRSGGPRGTSPRDHQRMEARTATLQRAQRPRCAPRVCVPSAETYPAPGQKLSVALHRCLRHPSWHPQRPQPAGGDGAGLVKATRWRAGRRRPGTLLVNLSQLPEED